MNAANWNDDADIAAEVVAGNRDRFEEFVRRYHRPLLRVAVGRVGQPSLAEDLVQETFLAAFKSLHTYDSKYSFRTWLWTILLNQCRRALTKQQRRQALAPQTATAADWETDLVDPQASPQDQLQAGDRKQQLDQMLNRLPEDQAIAVRLRFFGELKFQEIADAMDCSLTTAKTRVRSGLQSLSNEITKPAAEARKTADPDGSPRERPSPEELI